MILRECRAADLLAVDEIERICFGAAHALPLLSLTQYRDLCGSGFVVAESGESIAGYVAAGIVLDQAKDLAWILGVAVAPGFQRRGLGSQLCTHVLATLRALDVKRVRATIAPENGPSFRMFDQLGFRIVADSPDYFGPGQRRLVLELGLYL